MEAQTSWSSTSKRCTRCDQCVRASRGRHSGVTRGCETACADEKLHDTTPSCRSAAIRFCLVGARSARSARHRKSLEIII